MRKLLAFAFLVGSLSAFGQEKSKPITRTEPNDFEDCVGCKNGKPLIYDFECKSFYWPTVDGYVPLKNLDNLKVRYNEQFRLRVINVNRYLYRVNINSEDISYTSEVPDMSFLPPIGASNAVSNLITSLTETSAAAIEAEELVAEEGGLITEMLGVKGNDAMKNFQFNTAIQYQMNKFLEDLKNFKDIIAEIEDAQVSVFNVCRTEPQCCTEPAILYSKIKKQLNQVEYSYQEASANVMMELSKEPKEIKRKETLEEELKSVKEIIGIFEMEVAELAKFAQISPAELTPEQQKRVKALKESVKDGKSKYEYNKLLKGPLENELVRVQSVIQYYNSLKKVQVMMTGVWEAYVVPTGDRLRQLILFHNNVSAKHFSYLSPPIFPTEGRIALGLHISPNEESEPYKWGVMPLDNDSLRIEVRVRKRMQVDFSTGAFIGFGNNLFSDRYAWRAVANSNSIIADSARFKLTNLGRSTIAPFGLAAFANVGGKLNDFFGIGGTLGIGSTLEAKPKPAFLGGLNFGFGKKQIVNFAIGLLVTPTEELNSSLYDLNAEYETQSELSYDWAWRIGGFASISYTIFNSAKKRGVGGSSKAKGKTVEPPKVDAPASISAETPKTD